MQKYGTAVHNSEYCAYQKNMCKNRDIPPVEPKHHPLFFAQSVLLLLPFQTDNIPCFTFFQAGRIFFLRLGFSTPSQKSRFEISQEYPIRIVQAPWMFCHVDTVLLRVGVCAGKHCALRPSAQSINPMLLCCYCICVFMAMSLFSAYFTLFWNFEFTQNS